MAKDLLGESIECWARTSTWAVDFMRAAGERPLWARLLLRFAMGQWAYREFIGMMDASERGGFVPYLGYELEQMDYHNDVVPFDWGKEREPIPLKRYEDAVR